VTRSILNRWAALLFAATVILDAPAVAKAAATADTMLVQVKSGTGTENAFVARPAGEGKAPAVIVVHEWWGLDGSIRDIARRLATQGYVAIVPDLYHGKVATDPMKAHELMRGLDEQEALTTLNGAEAWLRGQPRTAKSGIGIVGFCMGGGLALDYGLAHPLNAVIMFYGRPETDATKLTPLKAPLQAHYGQDDEGFPIPKVNQFKEALKKDGKSAEVYVYTGAGHAFMHEGLPSYRPDAARQAWARMLAFFQKNLKG
jgi:carboxymethylenebutenolidase